MTDDSPMKPADPADLEFAIAYAIGRTSLRPRHKEARMNDLDCAIAAKEIRKYLEMSGFVIMKKPPLKAHSIP